MRCCCGLVEWEEHKCMWSTCAIHHQLYMWTHISLCQCTNVRHAICFVFVSSFLFALICVFVCSHSNAWSLSCCCFLLMHTDLNVISDSIYHDLFKLLDLSWPNKFVQCLFNLCSHIMFLMCHDSLSVKCVGSCLSCLNHGCIAIRSHTPSLVGWCALMHCHMLNMHWISNIFPITLSLLLWFGGMKWADMHVINLCHPSSTWHVNQRQLLPVCNC